MAFPKTWKEYEKEYGFYDVKEVYTNNSRLIPSFRVKQWLDHLEQEPCEDAISRQAVLGVQAKYAEHMGSTKFWQMRDDIKALPPVTPKHTNEEIQKMQEMEQAEIQKAYELGKEDKIKVLDKIRAEIEKQEKWLLQAGYNAYNVDIAFSSIKSVLTESEEV